MNTLIEFFKGTSWYIYIIIFLLKIIEITFTTVRIILVNKGFKLYAFIAGLSEIFIWVFCASTVLTGLPTDPLKAVPYGVGFAVGLVVGSLIEEWLAFGKVQVEIICDTDKSEEIASFIRSQQIGVTEVDARGIKGDRKLLILFVNRKGIKQIVSDVSKISDRAVIMINTVTSIQGGTIPKRNSFLIK